MTAGRVWVGVDPGFKSGGIVIIDAAGMVVAHCRLSKLTLREWYEFVADHTCGRDARAAMELVASMPGQGVSSTFKFGRGTGRLEAILTAAGVAYEEVTPATWQREYRLAKGLGKPARKQLLRGHAQRLFPGVDVPTESADAFLLAHHARTAGSWAVTERENP